MTAAWPKSATASMEPHCLSEFGACVACNQAVHTVGPGGAVHTATGMFRCTGWPGGTAEINPQASEEDHQNDIDEACRIAEQEARESTSSDIGYELGRMVERLEAKYLGDDAAGQAAIKDIFDTFRDELADL